MFHLTLRAAWHENRWDGTVCRNPSQNTFCIALDRIRLERDDAAEERTAGRPLGDLTDADLPACKAESGAFMNRASWTRTFRHPYRDNDKTERTHGCLKDTRVVVPEYATFAVPFAWMLKSNQNELDRSLPNRLTPDDSAPFPTPWVFGAKRQEEISELVFSRLSDERSLVFFYTKEGQPIDENLSRLVVGVGRILKVGKLLRYESTAPHTYALWDRVIRHSIRPEGHDGFLLPYHDYLEPTGNDDEDARRRSLLSDIAVTVDPGHMEEFSFAAELAGSGTALSILTRCLHAVRLVRQHGIAKGPWERREEWLNEQIAAVWKERGAFPGTGSVLEALGMRLGTSLFLELLSSGMIRSDDDPWPVVDAILRGHKSPPQPAYKDDLDAVRATWEGLGEERRALLLLLSRFDLTPGQARRWFDPTERSKATHQAIADSAILENPYRIAEADLGDSRDVPVTIGIIDRGLMPECTIAAKHPVPPPSAVGSVLDKRRVRAAFVSSLRRAADQGDSLLSVDEILERLPKLDLTQPCVVGMDWITANSAFLSGVIEMLDIIARSGDEERQIPALQLSEYKRQEDRLRSILRARAQAQLPPVSANWSSLLQRAISEAGGTVDTGNSRHSDALAEQAAALERITKRKLSVLTGKAGTGKTSVLGALLLCDPIVIEGVLLLAPTGKARVRLGRAANAEAMTIAQFLNRLGRYDGIRQKPLLTGKDKYRRERTVVIDEASMLTMDTLLAVFEALDMGHVKRVILVGDPNQLPPIGVGRPFADLIASLEGYAEADDPKTKATAEAMARLTVEVRAVAGEPSDTLRLASWFTRESQYPDADRILSAVEMGGSFNDLEIVYWQTPEDLRNRLLEQFAKQLGIKGTGDIQGFNRALGFTEKGWMPFDAPEGVESFQILSPVRMHPHGVYETNRWVQRSFRGPEIRRAREHQGTSLGDEEIVVCDKVIQLENQTRTAYDGSQQRDEYIANGEIGTVCPGKGGWLNVVFSGRPGLRFGYCGRDFRQGSGPLELAYALTVHKAQGSEFRKVFVIVPKNCRLLSRELLYTGLTRSRDRLVLLMEGNDGSGLYDLTKPERSETARRNTNLFAGVVREHIDLTPYADHLIHRTEKGHMVRSKSELVIANLLYRTEGLRDYEYERPLEGVSVPGRLRPDFTFISPAGEPILWEHLGMMAHDDYRRSWEWKRDWYLQNGFCEGENLLTTQDDNNGGLDSVKIKEVAEHIRLLL